MRHIQLTDYRNDVSVRELLALAAAAVGSSFPRELFDSCTGVRVLAHTDAAGRVIALATYRHSDDYALRLEHLAVLPGHRGRGLARVLLLELRRLHQKSIWAAANEHAVGFFRALGCVVSASASDPRRTEAPRFLCTLPHMPLLRSQPTGDPKFESVDGRPSTGIISLSKPQPSWANDYAAIERLLTAALGSRAIAVEHTGSTSVPDLPAKPIIDVALLVEDADREERYVEALRSAGLIFWHREPGWYAHRMFKTAPGSSLADANIHVFSAGSPEYLRMVLFRDHLRTHDAQRAEYARVKQQAAAQLAEQFGEAGLVMDYNRIKEPFIQRVHQQIFRG